MADLVAVLMGENKTQVPALARQALDGLAAELEKLGNRVKGIEAAILAWHKDNEASRRLATIPDVGPITASAIVATVTDPRPHSGPCTNAPCRATKPSSVAVYSPGVCLPRKPRPRSPAWC